MLRRLFRRKRDSEDARATAERERQGRETERARHRLEAEAAKQRAQAESLGSTQDPFGGWP